MIQRNQDLKAIFYEGKITSSLECDLSTQNHPVILSIDICCQQDDAIPHS